MKTLVYFRLADHIASMCPVTGVAALPLVSFMQFLYQSWIFKCVAVAVSVATASAANKIWIFKCLNCLRIIIIILFHNFT